jgi:glycosyltransferase involved in cell wall biosynthesis
LVTETSVSIIIPAYNAGDKIRSTLTRIEQVLSQCPWNYEIIVVNDGSTDETERAVRSRLESDPKIKLISYAQNIGKGYAVRKGTAEAKSDVIILLDSDSDIDAEHIAAYVRALKQYDMVIASKRNPLSNYEAPFVRKILSTSFNVLVKLFVGIQYSDTQAGLKAFRRSAFETIVKMGLVKRFAFDVELLALASLLKLRVVEAPVKVQISSGFSLKSIMYMALDLLGIVYRLRVVRWYQSNLNGKKLNYKPIIRI